MSSAASDFDIKRVSNNRSDPKNKFYKVDELRNFARFFKIRASGTKSELVNLITDYWNRRNDGKTSDNKTSLNDKPAAFGSIEIRKGENKTLPTNKKVHVAGHSTDHSTCLNILNSPTSNQLLVFPETSKDLDKKQPDDSFVNKLLDTIEMLQKDLKSEKDLSLNLNVQLNESQKKSTAAEAIRQCIMCCKNDRTIMFSPCNHIISCNDCGYKVAKCPSCRRAVASRIKVYL